MEKEKQAYFAGKYFDTVDEMLEYSSKFPDMPLDLEWYRDFLDMRFREAEHTAQIWQSQRQVFTNRHAILVLKEALWGWN